MKIEFCIENIQSALAAAKHKADTVELCSDLNQDGLTPSLELIKNCKKVYHGEIHMMIRPRAGDFNYNKAELNLMKASIITAHKNNVSGVVFGILNQEKAVDIEKNKYLLSISKKLNLKTTFHRAFDSCNHPINNFNAITKLGFNRILTSGHENKAIDGLGLIKTLIKKNESSTQIIAGSGINQNNIAHFCNIGLDGIHFTIHNKNKIAADLKYIDQKKIEGVLTFINRH